MRDRAVRIFQHTPGLLLVGSPKQPWASGPVLQHKSRLGNLSHQALNLGILVSGWEGPRFASACTRGVLPQGMSLNQCLHLTAPVTVNTVNI